MHLPEFWTMRYRDMSMASVIEEYVKNMREHRTISVTVDIMVKLEDECGHTGFFFCLCQTRQTNETPYNKTRLRH